MCKQGWEDDRAVSADFGGRLPELEVALQGRTPQAVVEEQWDWLGAPLRLRIASYVGAGRVPDSLVTSVRCLVAVGDSVAACETLRDTHIWPGGRREGHESYARTAAREVYEETGWMISEDTATLLGFLHFEHLVQPPSDYKYPSPDFLQLIFGARVGDPAANVPRSWSDAQGWEVRSYLVKADEVLDIPLSEIQVPFLRAFLDGTFCDPRS
jgi:hypothetical protein